MSPKLLSAQATAPREILLTFDRDVIVTNPNGFHFQAQDVPAVPVSVVWAEPAGMAVIVTVHTEMTPRARYSVLAAGVSSAAGIPIAPPHDRLIVVGWEPPRSEKRRFQLWEMLPKHNRRADVTGDLRKLISCLQEITDLLFVEADRFPDIFDIERAPEVFLDRILRDLGNPFAFELDELGKRRLASVLVQMYKQKGTAPGIRNAIRFFLGIDVEPIIGVLGGSLVLGESELGIDWELGPSERFARYAFSVRVPRRLTEIERRQILEIATYIRPGHTHFLGLLEPMGPEVIEEWVLGVGELGESSLLG